MNGGGEQRRVSPTERAWLVADRMGPPFVNQLVVLGEGALEIHTLERATAAVAAVHPGLRLRCKNWGPRATWESSGPPPSVRAVNAPNWTTRSGHGAEDFLTAPLDPFRGPVAEVLWVQSQAGPALVMRTHHAVTDGGGSLLIAADLFRALRGEQPLGAEAGPLTDVALARSLRPAPPQSWLANCAPPLGKLGGRVGGGVTWYRTTLPNAPSKLTARAAVAVALASAAGGGQAHRLRIQVPVDLRRHVPDVRTTANLTGFVRLESHDWLSAPQPVEVAHAQLMDALQRKSELQQVADTALLHWLPLSLMAAAGRSLVHKALTTGNFEVSASVSNLGRMPVEEYRGGGFRANCAFWIPPGSDAMPAFITLAGGPGGIELAAAMPRSLAHEDTLGRWFSAFAEAIHNSSAGPNR